MMRLSALLVYWLCWCIGLEAPMTDCGLFYQISRSPSVCRPGSRPAARSKPHSRGGAVTRRLRLQSNDSVVSEQKNRSHLRPRLLCKCPGSRETRRQRKQSREEKSGEERREIARTDELEWHIAESNGSRETKRSQHRGNAVECREKKNTISTVETQRKGTEKDAVVVALAPLRSSPSAARSRLDLPEPTGPTTATSSPCAAFHCHIVASQ